MSIGTQRPRTSHARVFRRTAVISVVLAAVIAMPASAEVVDSETTIGDGSVVTADSAPLGPAGVPTAVLTVGDVYGGLETPPNMTADETDALLADPVSYVDDEATYWSNVYSKRFRLSKAEATKLARTLRDHSLASAFGILGVPVLPPQIRAIITAIAGAFAYEFNRASNRVFDAIADLSPTHNYVCGAVSLQILRTRLRFLPDPPVLPVVARPNVTAAPCP